jgi:hypothetical protein
MAACVPDNDPERASLEIPEWMFDKTQCSKMYVSVQPRVCWMALAELSSLIQQSWCESGRCAVKNQHRFFTVEGGADASQRSIPATGAVESLSSSPKTAPMETDAQRGTAKRDWPASADVERPLPSNSLCGKARGGRK